LTKLFNDLEFLYTWRSYQEKLLNDFSLHIADNHFHVIAPPGSGKTLLGLEIVKRLNKKTLILSPTLTIRNQWEDRLQNFFTKDKTYQKTSFDIKKPSDITFSTYQSLQSFYKKFEDKDLFFQFFKKQGIEVLLVDEAHHLKNTWWQSLFELKNNLDLTIIALTATPPYDSTAIELTKYFKLCGEVDAEIAVPDLVKEGDLAPHQDFVFLSQPKGTDIDFIVNFRLKVSNFISELKTDNNFLTFIKRHRFYKTTEDNLEELYGKPEYFSAILIYLNAVGEKIPRKKFKILGFERGDKIEFPQLTYQWIEVLFQNLLVDDSENLINEEVYLSELALKLKKLHLFSNKKVNLLGNDDLYKTLSQNPSKLDSIVSIINSEQLVLEDNLRAVVLTDYIRKEFLNTSIENLPLINKLGVLPIFHYLRNGISKKETLAVLTGSIVIIHKSILEKFKEIQFFDKKYETELLSDDSFVIIPKLDNTVAVITELFESGYINILVGTKSLLGEGWDAPSINSLVLASFVGSFVTSNQMRGRAIRKDTQAPNKTGSIWHLACLDPTIEDGGKDIGTLKRRFNVFMGISNLDNLGIENGIERLGLPNNFTNDNFEAINQKTLQKSRDRSEVSSKWKKSIAKGYQLTKQLRIFYSDRKEFSKQKKVNFNDAVRYFIIELFFGVLLFFAKFILQNINLVNSKGVLYFVYALLFGFILNYGYKTFLAIKMYIQYGFMHKKIKRMGNAVLQTLSDLGYITSDMKTISIQSNLFDKGNVSCIITGVNQYESTLFINALEEIVQPIENPRYLIIIKNYFRKKMNIQNFYAVPTIFGTHKKDSSLFLKNWKNELGHSKLFYTRKLEGRRLLLKARIYHSSNTFKSVTKNTVVWK